MRVSSTRCSSRESVEPMVELAVQLRALGAEVWRYARPDRAAAERREAPVATGVLPAGGWR